MRYLLVYFFVVLSLFSAVSAVSLNGDYVRSTTKKAFEKSENLYDIFITNYDDNFQFDERLEGANALFETMLQQFQEDYYSPTPPNRFINIKAVCETYNYTLQPYSPKLWRKFHHTHLPFYSLFAVFMDTEKSHYDFANEFQQVQQDPSFCIDTWVEILSLLICSDTSVDHDNFLLAIMGSALLNGIRFEAGETFAVLLTNNFPLFYVDEQYPHALNLPRKKARSDEKGQISQILQRFYFSAANEIGYKEFFRLTPSQFEKISEAFQRAGFGKSLNSIPIEDKNGLMFPISIWRVLEGGFSTRQQRDQVLSDFSVRKFHLEAYLKFRDVEAQEGLNQDPSNAKELIHKEILAHAGNKSTKFLEDKIKEFSGQNLEKDLEIFNKIKDNSIWVEIENERERLAHIIFIEPISVPPSEAVSEKKPNPPFNKINKKTGNKKTASKKNNKVEPRSNKKSHAEKNEPQQKPSEPAATQKNGPQTGKKPKLTTSKIRKKKNRPTTSGPKISESLLNEGYPLTTPPLPQQPTTQEKPAKSKRKQKNGFLAKALNTAQLVRGVLGNGPGHLSGVYAPEIVRKLNSCVLQRTSKVITLANYNTRALRWSNETDRQEIIRGTENEVNANIAWYKAVKDNFYNALERIDKLVKDLNAAQVVFQPNVEIIYEIKQLESSITQVDMAAYPVIPERLSMPISPEDRITLVIMANSLTYALIEQIEKIRVYMIEPLEALLNDKG